MIRILSPQISVAPQSSQGGTVFDRELLKALAAMGARVDIVLPRNEPHEQVPGWHVVRAGRCLRYTFEYNVRFLQAVERLARSHPFDLYRVHSPSLAPLGLWMQRRTHKPLVAHYHHVEPDRPVHNRISQAALPCYDLITVDSRFVLDQLISIFGVDASRAVVTYPGVAPHYTPGPPDPALRAELGADGRVLILTMSVLAPRKNLRLLLEAIAAALAVRPNLLLVVVGDGPQRIELETHARSLGIEQSVRFAGYVDEARKLALLRTADLFIFPSLLEGFGMVVAEAMACGLPVVCSTAASLPEVTGDAALGVEPTDRDGFSAALLQLAGDANLRRTLAAAGRERAAALFSWRRTAQTTLDAYRRLLPTEVQP